MGLLVAVVVRVAVLVVVEVVLGVVLDFRVALIGALVVGLAAGDLVFTSPFACGFLSVARGFAGKLETLGLTCGADAGRAAPTLVFVVAGLAVVPKIQFYH